MTISIPLTKGYVAIVSDEDADLAQLKWYPADKNGRIYVWGKTGAYINGQRKTVHLHRIILERMLNRTLASNELVDHIDNIPLNNLRDNLRLATKATNAYNMKKSKNNTSGYKGVWFHKLSKLWAAEIRINNKKIALGYFHTPEEASKAYDEAAKQYHGEFYNPV